MVSTELTILSAHNRLWSLTDNNLADLSHNFVRLSSGLQLHYISRNHSPGFTNLVICLHGFPDSWHVFYRTLKADTFAATETRILALDLPGFGGSDDLEEYGANAVMNVVVEAVGTLKQRYLWYMRDEGADVKCILVGHDWGGLIAYRVAAETEGLVDRVVAINTAYVSLFLVAWAECPALTLMDVDAIGEAEYGDCH
jgi:pimeloyl-ACP methyl ester carboxylesterase